MKKLKCDDCGMVFSENEQSCPNCGCPKSECHTYEEPTQGETPNEQLKVEPQQKMTETMQQKSKERLNGQLTKCCDCGGVVSISACRCPHCGAIFHKPMDFGNAIYECFCKKFSTFSGRARRSEFWPFALLVGMLCGTLIIIKSEGESDPHPEWLPFWITFIPMLAATVRRLHDIGKSGWWVLLPFIPLFFLFKDSDKEENEYGSSPKYQQ